jgi:hypothetical protein
MTEADTTMPPTPRCDNGPPKLSAEVALAFLEPLIADFEGGMCALDAVLRDVTPLIEDDHADIVAALRFMVRQLNGISIEMDQAVRAAEGAA